MTETLPAAPGSYALVMRNHVRKHVDVGRLGRILFERGYLVYVGSAFGPGGLRARVGRHASTNKTLHWHVDYLRPHVELEEAWLTTDAGNREHDWAQRLGARLEIAHPRFGSSDCRCVSHLFFADDRPAPDLIGEDVCIASFFREPNVYLPR
ncbi:MAG: GIY-YIG nuclease family protein [Gammaproteobacteria bacterium]